ncbi:hypothetical protein EDD11_001200 [Mortierella claussenii]|nr:hypothetical protein EDD11_001200 [Mortierella claussenii]
MAILDFQKDSKKSISLHFHTPELGPDGQPLYYSTPEAPAIIKGHVEFHTVEPTNGSDIVLSFDARAESKWKERYGESTASFHQICKLQEKTWDVKLNRTNPKMIAVGVTRYDFEVALDSELPPSIHGKRGWFHYRFKAHIRRDFPRRDMAAKRLVWVYSSSIRANEQMQPKIYKEIFNDMVSFSCTLPSDVFYQGQIVPLKVTFEPFRENSIFKGQDLVVVSAIVKLKQYTTLIEKKLLTSRRKEKKVILNLPVAIENWGPQTDRGFTETIMVELPGARQLAAAIESGALIKTHCLKLIMMVRTSTMTEKEAREIRVEMGVRITSPRPEHFKSMNPHSVALMAPPPYQSFDSDEDLHTQREFASPSAPPQFDYGSSNSPFPVDAKDANQHAYGSSQ